MIADWAEVGLPLLIMLICYSHASYLLQSCQLTLTECLITAVLSGLSIVHLKSPAVAG
jgi:hypothetical protein